jgi:putative ABC transport system permease protein
MALVLGDIRYALRRWAARPGLAITVVLTLGLGIGTTTAIFSLVDGVLLRPLAWREPHRLVSIFIVRPAWRTDPVLSFQWDRGFLTWPTFRDLQQQMATFDAVAAWRRTRALTIAGASDVVQGYNVSSTFLPTLGAQPYAGRGFTAAEDEAPSDSVMVSYEAWQRRFGSDPGIVGRRISVDDVPRTIIGVLAPRFQFEGEPPEVLIPFGAYPASQRMQDNYAYRVVARLAAGVTLEQAAAGAVPIVGGGEGRNARNARLVSIPDDQLGQSRAPLFTLLAASVLLLLIACANVAGLLLGEAGARRHEIAVRRALGAGRWRVTGQMLAESAMLAVGGGIAGLVAAWWILPALVALAPTRLPRIDTVSIDARVLVFAAVLCAVTTVLSGAMPSLAGAATPALDALHSSRTAARSRSRAQRVMVSAQVALAVVLLAGAVLLGETVVRLTSLPVGFTSENLLVVGVTPTSAAASAALQRAQAEAALLERVRGLPGVELAATTFAPPFFSNYGSNTIEVTGRPGEPLTAQRHVVSEDFFATMGTPILRGRGFEPSDVREPLLGPPPVGQEVTESLGVAIVSRELERRYFGGNAQGQRIRFNRLWLDVIGVVADVKTRQYTEESGPAFYVYSRQMPYIVGGQFIIRASGDPAELIPRVREVLAGFDSRLAIASMDTMETLMERSVANERYRATLSSAFGGGALMLAAIGLFGLLTRAVNERRREIGVRMAVGAKPADVVRLVMREGGLLVAGGLLVGVPVALASAQLIRSQLYGVGPSDPRVFILVAAVLSTVGCVAMIFPALRASGVDPISTLRAE